MSGKKRLIDQWRQGHRTGFKLREVEQELKAHGFSVEESKKHNKARHPDLKGHPEFPFGVIVFSSHAHGNQGEIDAAAIRDFVKAIDWLES